MGGCVHGWVLSMGGVVHGWVWSRVLECSTFLLYKTGRLEYPWGRYKFKGISISAKMMPSKNVKRSQFC
jgi:hypothetical protein